MTTDQTIGAIILCGGRSVRMGSDKAWLKAGNKPFLSRIVRVADTVLQPVVVVAADQQTLPELPKHIHVVRDELPNAGPLIGCLSGLDALLAARPDANSFFLLSVDMPGVGTELLSELMARRKPERALVICEGTRPFPFPGIYPASLRDRLSEKITGGERRLQALLKCAPLDEVPADDLRSIHPGRAGLQNINTPEDYQRLTKDFGDHQ